MSIRWAGFFSEILRELEFFRLIIQSINEKKKSFECWVGDELSSIFFLSRRSFLQSNFHILSSPDDLNS